MNTEGNRMASKEKGLVSLEQTSKLLGIPEHILRRAVTQYKVDGLREAKKGNSFRQYWLASILDNHEEIVASLRRISPASPFWGSEDADEAMKAARDLRETIEETEDADSVAYRMGVSRPTLRRWEREGKIIGVRPLGGKKIRYYRESIRSLEHAGKLA
ncbi:helix-turn-helix DNA binding protein [Gordonia phage Pleakley]|uniref:Helix-turn-helix DNA binding protein n=1 Tax=Gordonia phage Pleakley TaxID=2283246 RepID=A0A345M6I2_9CAUD|nr:helix-turn-helix DNA binding protein [Gordonia phage Pleakley]AXH49790.1 helix-turn-helix DNA binding protein [Gordonia phage Fury]AXH66103.1 helix-turn-helix DNA binding protein [Gordonia phage Pleakley]